VFEFVVLGEAPDIVGHARKSVWHLLTINILHVIVDFEVLLGKITVAAEEIVDVGVFLALLI
jgi:hypothetical protein